MSRREPDILCRRFEIEIRIAKVIYCTGDDLEDGKTEEDEVNALCDLLEANEYTTHITRNPTIELP